MKKVMSLIGVSALLLTSCGGDDISSKLDETFEEVLAAHQDAIASNLEEIIEESLAIEKKSSTSTLDLEVQAEGADISLEVDVTGSEDISDHSRVMSDTSLDINLEFAVNRLEFGPVGYTGSLGVVLDFISVGQEKFFMKMRDLAIVLDENPEIVTMINAFSGNIVDKWIVIDSGSLGIETNVQDLSQIIPNMAKNIGKAVRENTLFNLVEEKDSEDGYYVYDVTLNGDGLNGLLRGMTLAMDPSGASYEEIPVEGLGDIPGTLKISAQDKEYFMFSASSQNPDDASQEVAVDLYNTSDSYGMSFTADTGDDTFEIVIGMTKTDEQESEGTIKISSEGEDIVTGEVGFSYDVLDAEFSADLDVSIPDGEKFSIQIESTTDGERDNSVDIQEPEDAVSLGELGLPIE